MKNLPGDLGVISGLGRSSRGGNGYALQYSCLENSMDRGAWRATVHRLAESWIGLSDSHFHFQKETCSNCDDDKTPATIATNDFSASPCGLHSSLFYIHCFFPL